MRWLVLVLLAIFLSTGCDMNPQPEVPGSDEPGGAAGAAGAGAQPGPPGAAEDDPDRASDTDPSDYNGGLQSGNKASRPDAGPVRADPDADAAPAPPIVVVN